MTHGRVLIMPTYDRCYVTQEFIGFFYRVDTSAIRRAIKRTEARAKHLFGVKREPWLSREETAAVMIDCPEQPIQRPSDDASQRQHYSGKKKRHTLKTEYFVNEKDRIADVSESDPGSRHDLNIRRIGPDLPTEARAYAGSSYQGYDREHSTLDIYPIAWGTPAVYLALEWRVRHGVGTNAVSDIVTE